MLDQIDLIVDFTVTPQFPYARTFSMMCPDCGQETVYKINEVSEKSVECGLFCEKCKEWVMYDVKPKSQVDVTKYYLVASLKGVDSEVKEKISSKLKDLCDKKLEQDRIIVLDQARNIEDILSIMKAYNISYGINPPYPHKIPELNPPYKSEWTEEDVRKLMEANPGLKITAEEMNALD